MSKLSIIIPSRNETFLPHTVADIFLHATQEIEVIVVLDGYWPNPPLEDRKNLILIHRGQARGMRAAINAASAIAKGEYLMKCDAHCMFDQGFDEILKADCDDDWLVVPRRKRLDANNWCLQDPDRTPIDYEFLSYPWWKPEQIGLHGTQWTERTRARKDILIDEDMSFQGSCWFMKKKLFDKFAPMQEEGYGTFIGEPQEIGLKVWLGGGKQVRNKKTWYAHLHKGKIYGRGYSVNQGELKRGNLYSADYWYNNRWTERTRDLEWLVEHFWPVPFWPGVSRDTWKPLTLSQNGLE